MYLSWRARHKFLFVWPFSWVLKGENKNSNNNPSESQQGSLSPIALPLSALFLVSCLHHLVVDQVQITERLTSLPIALLC